MVLLRKKNCDLRHPTHLRLPVCAAWVILQKSPTISCKRALQLVALLRKETYNLRHPTHLRHPVCAAWVISHFTFVSGSSAERDLQRQNKNIQNCVQPIPLGVTFSNAVSKLKARTSLLPRFSEKRRSSFELWALKELSKMSPQVGLAVHVWHELQISHLLVALLQKETCNCYTKMYNIMYKYETLVTRVICMRDMSNMYHICMRDATHSYARHSYNCDTYYSCICMLMSHVTHMNESPVCLDRMRDATHSYARNESTRPNQSCMFPYR